MKKNALRILSVLLVCLTLIGNAESIIENVAGFTHPEIGEFIVFLYENRAPYFTIYDFVQYKIMPKSIPYRGIDLSNSKKSPTIEASMEKFFDSIEGKSKEAIPVVFEYQGILNDYSYYFENLSREDKIKAIRLLSGFDGIKGYSALKKIPGFEDMDISYLKESYEDYTVNIDGKDYPYRVLMFYMEEEDWQESYFERYAYIKVGRNWKLLQIIKEYSGEYRERNKYIHGVAGNRSSEYQQAIHDAFRGNTWYSSKDEVAVNENLSVNGKSIVVENTSVFRLPADLTYTYNKKGWLSSIEYTLKSHEAFYSAFVSLYIRYYDPSGNFENGYTWSLPDTFIELTTNNGSPVIRFTPRFDQSKTSAG